MPELDHIGIAVDDLDEAKRFLEQVLGLELVREGPQPALGVHAAFFRAGPALIEVFQVDDAEKGGARIGDGPGARIDHVALRVENLDAATRAFAQNGVRVHGADRDAEQAEPLRTGDRINLWTHPETTDGVAYQLVEVDQEA